MPPRNFKGRTEGKKEGKNRGTGNYLKVAGVRTVVGDKVEFKDIVFYIQ